MTSIEIIEDRCKSCGLCIKYCPVGILEYSEDETKWGKVPHPTDTEGCRECRLCELACPDFAIHIEEGRD